jgi:hypothetical protein
MKIAKRAYHSILKFLKVYPGMEGESFDFHWPSVFGSVNRERLKKCNKNMVWRGSNWFQYMPRFCSPQRPCHAQVSQCGTPEYGRRATKTPIFINPRFGSFSIYNF